MDESIQMIKTKIMNTKDESLKELTTQAILSMSKDVPRDPNPKYEKRGKWGDKLKG